MNTNEAPGLNKFLIFLILLAVVFMFVIGLYEILFKPPSQNVDLQVNEITTYFGEDVLQSIN